MTPSLRELQMSFVAAMRDESPQILERLPIHESEKASKEIRLGVYSYAYWQRIQDSLEEDFPITFESLGTQAATLVQQFVYNKKPGLPNLGAVSELFFEFMIEQRPDLNEDLRVDFAFLQAALEDWSLQLKEQPLLHPSELASLSPENVSLLWNYSLRTIDSTLVFQKKGLLETEEATPEVVALLQHRSAMGSLHDLLAEIEHQQLTSEQASATIQFLTRHELLLFQAARPLAPKIG